MLQFISVLTTPAASGDVAFELETFNASTNVIATITITDILAQDSEIDTARKIYDGIVSYITINNLDYTGPVIFHDQENPATFRAHRTDHIISVFSQAQFTIKTLTNDPGCRISIDSTPTLLTLDEAESIAAVSGIDLETEDEEPLTDDQLQTLLELGSSRLVELLNNNIVICTYIKEFVGNGERAIPLDEGKPGITIDTPNTRRPYSLYITSEDSSGSPSSYGWNRASGYLRYRFNNQGMIAADQPFKIGSEFNISYVAGNFNIPKIVKLAVLYLVNELIASGSGLSNTSGDLKRLTGGNLTVEFFNTESKASEFFFELRAFII